MHLPNNDLNLHFQSEHGEISNKCYKCDSSFLTQDLLSKHTLDAHLQPTFPRLSEPASPTLYSQSGSDSLIFSPIGQLDGNSSVVSDTGQADHDQHLLNQELSVPRPSTSAVVNHSSTFTRPNMVAYKTSFSLDRKKQLKKLRNDTSNKDFEIEVSPSNENVNIHCNTGFYAKVAKPALEQLALGHSDSYDNVSIRCHDVTERNDATGALTTTVIMYRLCQHNLSIGQVTAHLHHTTRNIQVQGSALLPDGTKAPIWFVQKVLKNRFNELSKSQAVDIRQFNSKVEEMVSKYLDGSVTAECAGCKDNFNGRSSPEQCPDCRMYFHKFKCFPSSNHSCYIKKRSASCSTRKINSDNVPVTNMSRPVLGMKQPATAKGTTQAASVPRIGAPLSQAASTLAPVPGIGAPLFQVACTRAPSMVLVLHCPKLPVVPCPQSLVLLLLCSKLPVLLLQVPHCPKLAHLKLASRCNHQ